jgi:hypothetical protein
MYERGIGESALADLGLLKAVSKHKSVYFARAWAKFEDANPGTLRLVPPESRFRELESDYQKMREEMIFGESPEFANLLDVLRQIEQRVNS